ncbi:UDP-glucose 4-epimerase [bacterium HR33]|nr:UDP-glucose 4-epimerase [bacterium HR33]
MRAFVTGGTGFVGSHLVEALLDRGDEVLLLVRKPERAARLFGDRVGLVPGDLEDERALREGCSRADVVFHLAGLTVARKPEDFFRVNRDGTGRLVKAAQEASPRPRNLVYVSSLAASGPSSLGRPAVESDPPHPVSFYGKSKLAGEEEVRRSDLPWSIVRPPTVYGPRDRGLLRMFRLARKGVLPLVGKPEQELSFVYAGDLAAAIIAASAARCAGKTYFASHPEVVPLIRAAEAIYRAVAAAAGEPVSRPLVVRPPAFLARGLLSFIGWTSALAGKATVLSADKARELLAEAWACSPAALERDTGWRAEIDLATGLELTARWYSEHGWL